MVRTVYDAYLDLRNDLRKANIAGFQLEARALVCHALGFDFQEFDAHKGQFVFDEDDEKIRALRDRRLGGVPVQHIVGEWEFFGLPLYVTEDTLIPRPDTETLVQRGIDFLSGREKGRLLDLCCGSGCVGIAVLKHVSESINGVFADISEEALAVARKNIARHGLTARALTVQTDANMPCQPTSGKFNLIICNPPYIRTEEIATLDREVQAEPHIALDGGEDGLDFYRAIAKNYKPALARGGALMFEVGLGQWEDVLHILKQAGYRNVQVAKDLTGIERVVWGVGE